MKNTKRLVLLTKHKTKYVFLACFLFTVILVSCMKEGDFEFDKLASNQLNPSIAAPFVSSRLTLKDIIKDTSGIIQVNSADNNSITLVYNSTGLVSIMAKDLFVIPDQEIYADTTNLSLPSIPNGSSLYYSFTKPFPFEMPDPTKNQRMDSVYIKTAFLKINITTNFNHTTKFIVSSPNIIKPNGQTFSETFNIEYPRLSGDTTAPVRRRIDISGNKIRFDNSPGHKNEVIINYEQTIYGEGNANLPTYHTRFNSNIDSINYDKLIGYIGQYSFPLKDTTEIPMFSNQLEGQFEFDKVEVGAKLYNSYGVPINVKIDNFQATNGSQNVFVNDFPSTNPISLLYPTINQMGQTITTTLPNTQSSDIAQAINISPKFLYYAATGTSNPANNPAITNFVIDTSKFTVDVSVNLPLSGKVKGFVLQDTLNFDFGENANNISEATFRVNTWNAFPLNANVQVYFTNNFYTVIDSLVTNGQDVVSAGVINSVTHIVTSPTYSFNEYVIPTAKFDKIKYANKILIKARLYSPSYPSQIIKITNDDYIDIKLGMKVKLKANIK